MALRMLALLYRMPHSACRMRYKGWVVGACLWCVWAARTADTAPLWQTDTMRLSATGHVKWFLSTGRTLAEDREFLASQERVALEANLEVHRHLRLKVEYRVEALASLRGAADLSQLRQRSRQNVLDLDGVLVDERDFFMHHFLHRAVASLDVAPMRVAIGRQRIAWGTGKLWSPTDLFNPINPLSLERGERQGADAALVALALGPQTDVTAVYAPLPNGAVRKAARVHTTIRGIDLSALVGTRPGAWFVGGDFASPVGQALLRGEGIVAFQEDGPVVFQGVMAGEYTFPNSLGVVVEYFENGAGKSRSQEFKLQRLLAGEILALGRRFLGAIVSYELTPLIRVEVAVLQSLTDRSTYVNPKLTYAVTANTELAVAAGVTQGASRSEFGRLLNFYYAEFRWAF